MSKSTKTAFQRFEDFAKALIAVPRKEVDEQMEKYKRLKKKKKKSAA